MLEQFCQWRYHRLEGIHTDDNNVQRVKPTPIRRSRIKPILHYQPNRRAHYNLQHLPNIANNHYSTFSNHKLPINKTIETQMTVKSFPSISNSD